jgi:hypothetical protein
VLKYILQSDSLKTGCYNTRCAGFVQTSHAYYVGSSVLRTSTYGGIMVDLGINLIQVIYLGEF